MLCGMNSVKEGVCVGQKRMLVAGDGLTERGRGERERVAGGGDFCKE